MTSVVMPGIMGKDQRMLGQAMLSGLNGGADYGDDDNNADNQMLMWYQDGERVEGYDAIGIVSALMMNQLLRMYADSDISFASLGGEICLDALGEQVGSALDPQEHVDGNFNNKIACEGGGHTWQPGKGYPLALIHIIQIIFLTTYSLAFCFMIYCIVMVVLLKYYFTNLRGHGRSKDALEFMTRTRKMRHQGVRFFWAGILLFVIGTAMSSLANNRFPFYKGIVASVFIIICAIWISFAIARVMHIFIDCLEVQLFKRMQTICTNDEMIDNFLGGLDIDEDEEGDIRKSISMGVLPPRLTVEMENEMDKMTKGSRLSAGPMTHRPNLNIPPMSARSTMSLHSGSTNTETSRNTLANMDDDERQQEEYRSPIKGFRNKRGSITSLMNSRASRNDIDSQRASLASALPPNLDGRRSSLVLAQMLQMAEENGRASVLSQQSQSSWKKNRGNSSSDSIPGMNPPLNQRPNGTPKKNPGGKRWSTGAAIIGALRPSNIWRRLSLLVSGSERSSTNQVANKLSAGSSKRNSASTVRSNRPPVSRGLSARSLLSVSNRSNGSRRLSADDLGSNKSLIEDLLASRSPKLSKRLKRMDSNLSSSGRSRGGMSRLSVGSEEGASMASNEDVARLMRQMQQQQLEHSMRSPRPPKFGGSARRKRRKSMSVLQLGGNY